MKTDNIHFTGLDARQLKSVVMRDVGLGVPFAKAVKELSAIGAKEGFDVFVQNSESVVKGQAYSYNPSKAFPNDFYFPWAQDNLTFTPDGKMLGNYLLRSINKSLENCIKRPIHELKHHIQGGNFFIVKDSQKHSVIMGKEELNFYDEKSIKTEFGVEKIYPISQPEFHIDMAIRPLKDKTVLVNDDKLTFKYLRQAIESARQYSKTARDKEVRKVQLGLENIFDNFNIARYYDEYKNCADTAVELSQYGFKPVRVPGRVLRTTEKTDIDDDNHYLANFMNAIVHEKKDGSLVYITNKSKLDDMIGITPEIEKKINFSFQKMFTDSIKPYVKEENIHFIDGGGYIAKQLEYSQGGIHCLCAEVPVIK